MLLLTCTADDRPRPEPQASEGARAARAAARRRSRAVAPAERGGAPLPRARGRVLARRPEGRGPGRPRPDLLRAVGGQPGHPGARRARRADAVRDAAAAAPGRAAAARAARSEGPGGGRRPVARLDASGRTPASSPTATTPSSGRRARATRRRGTSARSRCPPRRASRAAPPPGEEGGADRSAPGREGAPAASPRSGAAGGRARARGGRRPRDRPARPGARGRGAVARRRRRRGRPPARGRGLEPPAHRARHRSPASPAVPRRTTSRASRRGRGPSSTRAAGSTRPTSTGSSRQVAAAWDPMAPLEARDPDRSMFGHKDRFTLLGVTLDGGGHLKNVVVAQTSGVDFLDRAAMTAFRSAQPFVNPPRGIVGRERRDQVLLRLLRRARPARPAPLPRAGPRRRPATTLSSRARWDRRPPSSPPPRTPRSRALLWAAAALYALAALAAALAPPRRARRSSPLGVAVHLAGDRRAAGSPSASSRSRTRWSRSTRPRSRGDRGGGRVAPVARVPRSRSSPWLGAAMAAALSFPGDLRWPPPLMRTIWYPLHVPLSFLAYATWAAAAAAAVAWWARRGRGLARARRSARALGARALVARDGDRRGLGRRRVGRLVHVGPEGDLVRHPLVPLRRLRPREAHAVACRAAPWVRPALAALGFAFVLVAYVGTSFFFGRSSPCLRIAARPPRLAPLAGARRRLRPRDGRAPRGGLVRRRGDARRRVGRDRDGRPARLLRAAARSRTSGCTCSSRWRRSTR